MRSCYTLDMKNLIDLKTIDRGGRTVTIKQLPDNRLVLVSQDGYLERREVVFMSNKGERKS